jgi:hypothetical protein
MGRRSPGLCNRARRSDGWDRGGRRRVRDRPPDPSVRDSSPAPSAWSRFSLRRRCGTDSADCWTPGSYSGGPRPLPPPRRRCSDPRLIPGPCPPAWRAMSANARRSRSFEGASRHSLRIPWPFADRSRGSSVEDLPDELPHTVLRVWRPTGGRGAGSRQPKPTLRRP